MTQFNPDLFLSATHTETLQKRPPIPPGEYTGIVSMGKLSQWQSRDGSKSGYRYDAPITLELPDPVRAATGIAQPTLKLTYGIMLDMKEDGTGIDFAPGRNSRLRTFLESLGLNKAGEPWSFQQTEGRPLRVRISHRPLESGDVVEDIAGVAAL